MRITPSRICLPINRVVKPKPSLGVHVQILDASGEDVSDLTTNHWAAESGGVLASIVSESRSPTCQYPHPCFCRISVIGGHKSDVTAVLEGIAAPAQATVEQ